MEFRKIKYWPFIVGFGLFSWALIYTVLFYDISYNTTDTPNFVGATQIILGHDHAVDTQSRITKPAVLLLPALLHYTTNLPIEWGMRLQNMGFFIALGFLILALLKQLGFTDKEQWLGLFCYFTIQTFAYTSTMLINDIAGHFFAFLIAYYYFKNAFFWTFQNSVFLALFIWLGLLSKESAGVVLLPIAVHAWFILPRKQTLKVFLAFLIAFLDTSLVQLFIRYFYAQNDLFTNWLEEFQNNGGFTGSLAQIIHAFDLYWLGIFAGFISLWKGRKAPYFKVWWWSGIMVLPAMFIWPTVQDRTVFALAPVLLIVLLYGLRSFPFKNPIIFIGIAQVIVVFLIYQYQIPHLLPILYGFGVLLILLFWWYQKKKTKLNVQ